MLIRQTAIVTLTLAISTSVSSLFLGTDHAAKANEENSGWIELAQTQTKKNRDARQRDRDDRQDTRQDCRQAEGAGKDKRDCKQDGRQN